MGEVLLKSGDVCRCQAGPAGAVSNYLAYGTGMDFMYTQLGVPYALTYEVYGSDNAGLLGGERARGARGGAYGVLWPECVCVQDVAQPPQHGRDHVNYGNAKLCANASR